MFYLSDKSPPTSPSPGTERTDLFLKGGNESWIIIVQPVTLGPTQAFKIKQCNTTQHSTAVRRTTMQYNKTRYNDTFLSVVTYFLAQLSGWSMSVSKSTISKIQP